MFKRVLHFGLYFLFEATDSHQNLFLLAPRPLDLALILVVDGKRHGEEHPGGISASEPTDAELAIHGRADGIVHFALGELQAELGLRPRLITAQGVQIRPRSKCQLCQFRFGCQQWIAPEFSGYIERGIVRDPSHQRLQAVPRQPHARLGLTHLIRKLQLRHFRTDQFHAGQVAGGNARLVHRHNLVECFKARSGQRGILFGEQQIREAALHVENQVACCVQQFQLRNRLAGFGDRDALLAFVAAFQNVVNAGIDLGGASGVGGRIETRAEYVEIVASEAQNWIRLESRLEDPRIRNAHTKPLREQTKIARQGLFEYLIERKRRRILRVPEGGARQCHYQTVKESPHGE